MNVLNKQTNEQINDPPTGHDQLKKNTNAPHGIDIPYQRHSHRQPLRRGCRGRLWSSLVLWVWSRARSHQHFGEMGLLCFLWCASHLCKSFEHAHYSRFDNHKSEWVSSHICAVRSMKLDRLRHLWAIWPTLQKWTWWFGLAITRLTTSGSKMHQTSSKRLQVIWITSSSVSSTDWALTHFP